MVGSVFPQMVLGGLLKIMTPHHKSFTNHLRLRRDWINHLYQLKFLTDGFLTSACTPMLMGTSVLYEHWAGISSLWLLCSPNSAFRSSRIYTPDSLAPSTLIAHLCKYVTRLEYPTAGEFWLAQRTSALYVGFYKVQSQVPSPGLCEVCDQLRAHHLLYVSCSPI